jgi:hypothetical protein
VGRFHVRNLVALRLALDAHNATCPQPANAILLKPIDHGLLGWDTLWGVPVIPDEGVLVKQIRIDCDHDTRLFERPVADDELLIGPRGRSWGQSERTSQHMS